MDTFSQFRVPNLDYFEVKIFFQGILQDLKFLKFQLKVKTIRWFEDYPPWQNKVNFTRVLSVATVQTNRIILDNFLFRQKSWRVEDVMVSKSHFLSFKKLNINNILISFFFLNITLRGVDSF